MFSRTIRAVRSVHGALALRAVQVRSQRGRLREIGRFLSRARAGFGDAHRLPAAAFARVAAADHARAVHGRDWQWQTGLCIALLEEAAIDGIPVLAIHPKGDFGNLLLTFSSALRRGIRTVDRRRRGRATWPRSCRRGAEIAAKQRAGLTSTYQDAARIARLKAAADFAIYTPGSSAGRSLSILRSLEAPPASLRDDKALLRERVSAFVSGLLGLVGIDADPLSTTARACSMAWKAQRVCPVRASSGRA